MQFMLADRGSAASGARSQLVRHGWLFLSVLVLLATPLVQQRWWPITDVSWLITVCEKILAGERLYIDVIETNPPFTVWLYMPPVAAAQWLPVAPEIAVFLWVVLLVAVGVGLAGWLALKSELLMARDLKLLLPGMLALMLLWPANAFGQREHVAVALFLPMIVLAAWRAGNAAKPRPSLAAWIAVGLCGSVLLLVKPYYALTPLALSLYLMWRKQDWRLLFTGENFVIGLVCGAYLAAVWVFYPAFLDVIYPILQDTYLRHTRPGLVVLIYLPAFALAAIVLRLLLKETKAGPLVVVLLIAAASACLPLVYQGKGWSYHAYPVIAFAFTAMMLLVLFPAKPNVLGSRRALLLIVLAATVVLNWQFFRATEKPSTGLIEQIVAATPGGRSIAVLGTDIATGNTLNRLVAGNWIERYCSDWLGGMAVLMEAQASSNGNRTAALRYGAMAADYRARKLQRLNELKPAIILVQHFDPVWAPFWQADDGYQTLLKRYRKIGENERMLAYTRQD